MPYTLRQPIGGRDLDREGIIISRHRTLGGAVRALKARERAFHRSGGFSTDYIWDEADETRVLISYDGGQRIFIA